MEDSVTTNEFYYLLLVLGAFAAFALGTSVAMLQYKAWLRRQGIVPVVHSRSPGKVVGGSRSVDGFADAA